MNLKTLSLPLILTAAVLFSACNEEGCTGSSAECIVENAIFTDLDGNDVDIRDFKGTLVLVDFWESWCGPCLQVFPSMEQLREEFPEKFTVLAVTTGFTETPDDARAFAEEHGYDFHFLFDQYGVFEQLGGQSIPFKAYVDPEGNFIKLELGSYGRQGDYNRARAMLAEYFDI